MMKTINTGMTHSISMLVANKPGVLSRIALVFARRGFNIDSLVVSPTENGSYSRITVSAKGDPAMVEQIIKQVAKLVDVLHIIEHTGEDVIDREIALIKVPTKKDNRAEILQVVDHFHASTEDFSDGSLVIQVSGSTAKLDSFLRILRTYGITEMVRSGKILMTRGKETT